MFYYEKYSIATAHFPDEEIYIHQEYRYIIFLEKLTEDEFKSLFSYVCGHLELIHPKSAIHILIKKAPAFSHRDLGSHIFIWSILYKKINLY